MSVHALPWRHLWKRIDRQGLCSGLQPLPVGNQLSLTQLGPRLHQSSLPPWEAAREQLYGVQSVYGLIVAMVGMEVRGVMRPELAMHWDNDAVEAAEFRHDYVTKARRRAIPAALLKTPNQ